MARFTEEFSEYIDPVFASVGATVYSNELAKKIRGENLKLKAQGKRVWNLIPQEGFQERVCLADADLVICGGRKGGGKVLTNDSDIITPFGIRKNGDLKVGDIISDPCTGGMERVIEIYEHPAHDFYRIFFDDGSWVDCGLEHLWKVRQTGYTHKRRRLYGLGVEDDYRIWTFGMIKKWLDEQEEGKHYMSGAKCRSRKYLVVPLCEPVRFTRAGNCMRRTDIDPYVIGAVIGDGCLTESATRYCDARLTSVDSDIIRELKKAGVVVSAMTQRKGSKTTDYELMSDKLREQLLISKLYGCKSADKFIPACYKFATIDERRAIIQGLMDTDGYIDNRGHCYFTSVSRTLAEDVQFIIRSLGGWASISIDTNSGYKDSNGDFVKCQDAYTVSIKTKDTSELFRLPRKKARCRRFNGGLSEVARRIVGYKHIGTKDGRCITVDSPDSLYMTNDFIVTHNTWVSLYKALYYIYNPDVAMYAFRRLEDDVKRGPWKASKPIFRGFGIPKEASYEWSFLDGQGATLKMEHLQDLSKVSDRFRGAELAYLDLEELPEFTRDNINVIQDFLAVNRNTAGVRSQMVCTCNPVGKSNKLRILLDWYIDPETDTVIPERDGKKRYLFFYGKDITEIAWGDSWQEVYSHPAAKQKIDLLLKGRDGMGPEDMILTMQFIEGDYSNNRILQLTDKRYISRLASSGGESVANDLQGVWRDIDSGSGLITREDMEAFFDNTERRDGTMRATADVALTGDFMVLFAFDGHHVCDMEAWRGAPSDEIPSFIDKFLRKNGVREENFAYDSNGLGLWLKDSFKRSFQFNNKSAASDPRLWNNLKSESAEKFVKAFKGREFSISEELLRRRFTDSRGRSFSIADRLMEERMAVKRKDSGEARFEIISKKQMKLEIGHSPDFMEALFMVMPLFEKKKTLVRTNFDFII